MSNIPSKTPIKNSKRLILKITSLSLASIFAFGIIAYVSLSNDKNYKELLAKQNHLTHLVTTVTDLQQVLLTLTKELSEPLSLVSFSTVHQNIIASEAALSELKSIDTPLLTRFFSQFLEVKKQAKILKSFLTKQQVLSQQKDPPERKMSWLAEELSSQQKKISSELASLLKYSETLKSHQKTSTLSHKETLESFESNALNRLYSLLGILAFSILLIHLIAAYFISKPLAQITKRMRDINEGNISDDIHGTDRNDEFGDIARMLHDFKENALKIEQMQQHLKHTLAESKQSNKIKNQFMARMSHELRTPLNAIVDCSERIVGSVEGTIDLQKLRTDIDKMANVGQNLLLMVDSVLELTDEGEDNVVKPESFNVREEVQQVLPTLETQILKNKNKFKVHCPDASLMMDSDPKKITKSLVNLIKNAAHFTQNGQLILTISAANLGDLKAIRFEVEDTGCGIELSKLRDLFSAFDQNNTGAAQGNTGLGLAIVKKITDDLHGEISVDSVLNRGSTFTMTLPCNHLQAHERAQNLLLSPLADAV